MKRGQQLLAAMSFLLGVAGCGDSWNSLNQMEKNVQNEVADVLSKVVDEASAKFAVTDSTEKMKNKWEGVKKRKEKYLKSQFLTGHAEKLDKVRAANPGFNMEQIIDVLQKEDPPVKADVIKDIRAKLMLASYADHDREVAAIFGRIKRELDRIRRLPEEPVESPPPTQKGPPGKMGGSYIRQALQIPQDVFGTGK